MHLILGSQSPRRKEILDYFSLPFEQILPFFDEDAIPFAGNPRQHTIILSEGKAASLAHKYPEAIIITADTIVYRKGKIYGKPIDKTKAYQALTELSGDWHSVFTSITVQNNLQVSSTVEETRVLFNDLTSEQIHQYHQKLHFEDKAGGYAIQQAGAMVIKKIDGCFYNVMGLPINSLRSLLIPLGIDLWNYIKEQRPL
jgi:septum formation protein